MFQKIKMEDGYWGVFLVSMNGSEKYLLTSPLENEGNADLFIREFNRISRTWNL
jgi:hypothetical protein